MGKKVKNKKQTKKTPNPCSYVAFSPFHPFKVHPPLKVRIKTFNSAF